MASFRCDLLSYINNLFWFPTLTSVFLRSSILEKKFPSVFVKLLDSKSSRSWISASNSTDAEICQILSGLTPLNSWCHKHSLKELKADLLEISRYKAEILGLNQDSPAAMKLNSLTFRFIPAFSSTYVLLPSDCDGNKHKLGKMEL